MTRIKIVKYSNKKGGGIWYKVICRHLYPSSSSFRDETKVFKTKQKAEYYLAHLTLKYA